VTATRWTSGTSGWDFG